MWNLFCLLSIRGSNRVAGEREAHKIRYIKRAMMAALISPEMGTVTNQAMKMFLNKRQSTDFLERSHPTATTDPTCDHTMEKFTNRCDD